MVNTQKLFAIAKTQVDQAVDTAGTTVVISDLEQVTAGDLTKTETPTNERTANAIVTIVGEGQAQVTPDLDIRATDWKLILKSSEALADIGQDVRVATCIDQRLIGRRGRVLGSVLDSSGAYTATFVRPRAQAKA